MPEKKAEDREQVDIYIQRNHEWNQIGLYIISTRPMSPDEYYDCLVDFVDQIKEGTINLKNILENQGNDPEH